MKIGVLSALFGNKSWEEACKLAKEAGAEATLTAHWYTGGTVGISSSLS